MPGQSWFKCVDWTPEKATALNDAFLALPTLIPELGSFEYGPDAGLREPGQNQDYCFTADFRDEASYFIFSRHPAYLRVVNEVIRPMLAPGAQITRIQFNLNHGTKSRQTLMRADPPLFNVRFGKSAREEGVAVDSPSSVLQV